MNLRLMADYQCWALWWDNPGRVGNVDPVELGLTPDLCAALNEWAQRYDDTLNQDDPPNSRFATPEELEAFVRDGEALAARVRAALGVDVRYVPPGA